MDTYLIESIICVISIGHPSLQIRFKFEVSEDYRSDNGVRDQNGEW